MPENLRAAIDAWKDADAKVKQAEQELTAAMDAYLGGHGPEVPAELVARVSLLRATAASRLKDSVEAIRQPSASVPRGNH
jgi:hypothetical protein